VICVKGNTIAFFLYDQDFHVKNNYHLKGTIFDGLLGLYVDNYNVKILPQVNTFFPQVMAYEFYNNNPIHEKSIHTIFKYMTTCRETPNAIDMDTINMDTNVISVLDKAKENSLNPVSRIARQSTTNTMGLNLFIGSRGKVL
jgi:hypothetical protein